MVEIGRSEMARRLQRLPTIELILGIWELVIESLEPEPLLCGCCCFVAPHCTLALLFILFFS